MKAAAGLEKRVLFSGTPLNEAKAVLILIHGRGADAESILSLADELNLKNICFAAPQAENNSWYPYSFLEDVKKNEPYLSNSLSVIKALTEFILSEGFSSDKIFYLGFSQGACLTLEFSARNPLRYGGVFALSGGLIGKEGRSFNYEGNLSDTPVFIGCSDIDPHIPLERLNLSEKVLNEIGAIVTKRIYPGMGHTINRDELDFITKMIDKASIL